MSSPVTRYRSTEVVFDSHLPEVVQPWFAYERRADSMAKGRNAEKVNVVLLPRAGWVLKPYIFDPGKVHETATGETGLLSADAGTLTLAASFQEFQTFRESGLTGVTYSGAATNGSLAFQKRIAAAGTFDDALDADQSAYPSPDTTDDIVAMDRVAVSVGNFEPDDTLLFRFFVPGSPLTASGSLVTLYFTGPSGSDAVADGVGQYALKLKGDGLAILYERKDEAISSTMWVKRHTFRWAHPQLVTGVQHSIAVGTDTVHLSSPDRYVGSRIYFRTHALPQAAEGNALIETLIAAAISAVDLAGAAFDSVYNVPRVDPPAVQIAPVRVDARRDVRVVCQVHKGRYPTSGSLTDDVFSLPFPPTTDELFYVEWYATSPSGCSVDVKMYDADTGVELSDGTLTISDELGGQRTYTPNDRQRNYFLKATFTGNGTRTPLLTEVRIIRAPVVETAPDTTPKVFPSSTSGLPKDSVRSVNISGPGDEPSHESLSVLIQDLTGGLDFLKTRGGMPIVVRTTFDSLGTDKSVLFRGYVKSASGRKKFSKGRNYPDPWAYEWDVTALGQWQRLQENLAPKRFVWFDQAAGAPYKVTDVIALLLKGAGVPAASIDVPDLPLRLFSEDAQDLVLEPGTPVSDVIVRLAFDYLGAYVVFDPNAGTGMWRLLQAKEAPYNNLARFETDHPGNGKVYADGAYADATETSPLGNTQTVKRTFIRRRTLEHKVEPPEGNIVCVYGGAKGAAAQAEGQQGFALLSQVLVNVGSYDFLNLGSAHANYPDVEGPDYLGRMVPILVYDPALSTQSAVNWVAKRVYRAACFAHTYLSFEAPLILVTDADDAEQTYPRPLRFYDAVQVWNAETEEYDQYIVASCSPFYRHDKVQMARYVLVTTSNIGDFASFQLREGLGRWRRSEDYASKRREGKTRTSPTYNNSQSQARNDFTTWMEQPEKGAEVIQDLDPESETFGEVFWMLDFDGLE